VTSPYERLASPQGAALLAAIAGFTETQLPAAAAAARKMVDKELAAAALATTFARRRAIAARKFARAGEMFFTRDGYEQSSSEAVARHRGARFAARTRVADLCGGIGGDTIGIASAIAGDARIESIELDGDALACAHHNAAVYDIVAKVAFHQGDALQWQLQEYDAAFADPSRRSRSARMTRPSEYQPPLASVLARARELPGRSLAVKIAPGLRVSDAALREASGAPVELEYVSERGECKEAVVWCGDLARFDGARRATVIDAAGPHTLDAAPGDDAPLTELRGWLGEPDPAVIRSGLLGALCERIGAAVLDRDVAYCTSDRPTTTPFVRWFEIDHVLPFGVKRLRAQLRAARVGELIVKTRAFPLRPEQITALLKPRGDTRAVLVCTTIGGEKTAILCRAPEPALPT
jgi:hypothetical protein